jgi:transcriptional regulator with XRE-family HTH domain
MNYGSAVKQKRQALGLTVNDVSEALGISAGMVSMLENGKVRPDMEKLIRLMRHLKMTTDEQDAVLRKAGLPALVS